MVILGIDPGFRYAGFGIIKKEGQKALLLDYGYLALSSTDSIPHRIGLFHDFFNNKIEQWQVTIVALETPFLGKNAQNFLKLGYLRGIIYFLANKHSLHITEFAPCEIKQSITGYGSAQKDQVARVIMQLFPGLKEQKKEDVTDAIAVTLCGLWSYNKRRT